jgi:hypothetical protein
MDGQDSIREWLKHVLDRLLNAEAGRRNSNRWIRRGFENV